MTGELTSAISGHSHALAVERAPLAQEIITQNPAKWFNFSSAPRSQSGFPGVAVQLGCIDEARGHLAAGTHVEFFVGYRIAFPWRRGHSWFP
jgi:hypothetical protein